MQRHQRCLLTLIHNKRRSSETTLRGTTGFFHCKCHHVSLDRNELWWGSLWDASGGGTVHLRSQKTILSYVLRENLTSHHVIAASLIHKSLFTINHWDKPWQLNKKKRIISQNKCIFFTKGLACLIPRTLHQTFRGFSQRSDPEHMPSQSKHKAKGLRLPGTDREFLKTGLPGPRIIHLGLPNPRSNVTSSRPWYCGLPCPENPPSVIITHVGLVHLYGQLPKTWHLSKQNKSASSTRNMRNAFSPLWVSVRTPLSLSERLKL